MYNVIHILHSVYRSVLLPASIGIRKNLQGNICGHVKIESCARHIEKAKACSPEGTSNMIVVILLVHWPIYPLVLSKVFSGGMLHLMLQIARIRLCPQAMPVSRVLINESHSCSHMKNNSDRAGCLCVVMPMTLRRYFKPGGALWAVSVFFSSSFFSSFLAQIEWDFHNLPTFKCQHQAETSL